MKLDIFDIADFIKINKVQEVTSPIALTATKMPNPAGIFSYEIFGYTTEERKNIFGYIDLRGNYFHPQLLKSLSRMGILGKIAQGLRYAVVADKKIHPIPDDQLDKFPEAETGVDFFYNNWEKIDWNSAALLTTDKSSSDDDLSIDKKNRIKLFRYLKKTEAFVKYWLVMPPYYRDFNASDDMTLGDDINKVYKELILKTMSLKKGFADEFGFSSVGVITKARIQDLLGILYDISLGPITGKTIDINTKELKGNSKRSMLKRNLIGRFLDFSASSVITSPVSSSTETVDDFAHFGEVQLPLQTFMAMGKPFFINYCQQLLENAADNLFLGTIRNEVKKVDSAQWSVDTVDKSITRFIKSAAEKDLPVEFEFVDIKNEKQTVCLTLSEYDQNKQLIIKRPMTYLDLYYMAAFEISKDKYSINTRYPIANNQNIYPAKVKVKSTNNTRHVYISLNDGEDLVEYKQYPYISYERITRDYGIRVYFD